MKNYLILMTVSSILLISGCKKKDNKDAEATITTTANPAGDVAASNSSYTYKATDGTRATVRFTNTEKEHTMTVEANRNKFQLDRKEITAEGSFYERNGIEGITKGDSVIVTQDKNIIELVRDK